ncbi:hypothetical protein Syun_019651 [Stephania yunnanensis]|uniref:TatD related DNase n=1 Tax=Stephania yunnanensis TaxID=152371 RepID=A0AAP0NXM2_9MAGN
MKLIDCHCHLQDPRIYHQAPQLIRTALDCGVLCFVVNGTAEKDWALVKQMGEQYRSCIVPCFGLHPWYVAERTPNWFDSLRGYFDSTPYAAVGEIGLDKGSHGKKISFTDQIQVFRQQLELAKQLERPVSIHCVRAFGDLLEIMQSVGPFPQGAILHSYMGSAEMVPSLAKLGAYFSFSGFLFSMKQLKAKKMLKMVPAERILLETDSPDGLPESNMGSSQQDPGDVSSSMKENHRQPGEAPTPIVGDSLNQNRASDDVPTSPTETSNHPANISKVLEYVAHLLDMSEEEVAEISYNNAVRLFSYPGSEIS